MFNIKKLKQTGDTIVEVLICLAIVSGGLTISYGTARRSLYQIRDAQERGEMLSLGQTELELLKNELNNDPQNDFYDKISGFLPAPSIVPVPANATNRAFCITNKKQVFANITDPRDPACAVNQSGEFYMDGTGFGSPPPTTPDTVDLTHPYRTGIVYHPYASNDPAPATRDEYSFLDEWYVLSGRYGAGGYGNERAFSVVPLMYRQHPSL